MVKYRGENLPAFKGYAGQLSRALYHLITEQKEVHIEKEDDTSIADNEYIVKAEQLKIIKAKELKFKSSDFIDTLHNWLDLCIKSKDKCVNTKFVLFLENKNDQDEMIKKCFAASSHHEAKEVVDDWINGINWKTKANAPREDFFKKNRELLYKIITNFTVQHPQGASSEEDIDNYLIKHYENNLGDDLPRFVEQLKGRFYSLAINSNRKIQKTSFTRSFWDTFLLDFGGHARCLKLPEIKDIQNRVKKELSERYVKQLRLIKIDSDMLTAAMKARIQWNLLRDEERSKGISTEQNFNEMYERLKERWNENKSVIYADSSIDDTQKGMKLYNESIKEDVVVDNVKFQDPRRVSRGVHNHMANFTNEYKIGWHPKYEEKLGNGNK